MAVVDTNHYNTATPTRYKVVYSDSRDRKKTITYSYNCFEDFKKSNVLIILASFQGTIHSHRLPDGSIRVYATHNGREYSLPNQENIKYNQTILLNFPFEDLILFTTSEQTILFKIVSQYFENHPE